MNESTGFLLIERDRDGNANLYVRKPDPERDQFCSEWSEWLDTIEAAKQGDHGRGYRPGDRHPSKDEQRSHEELKRRHRAALAFLRGGKSKRGRE
jgi:hypothetical protein